MRLERRIAAAVAAGVLLLAGGGAALAASGDGKAGPSCDQRLAKAEAHGVTVDQLIANVKARLLARIDAAEKAGRLSSERAAALRTRVNEGTQCGARRHVRARIAARGMVRAAAGFLGLDRKQLRAQLPGNSLADLAAKQGKSASALEDAMLAPAKARLAKAVAGGKLTQERANALLDRLGKRADRLATREFAA